METRAKHRKRTRGLTLWVVTILACGGVILPALPAQAAHVELVGDTVVDSSALTFEDGRFGFYPNGLSFQQEGLLSFNGYQYVGYFNGSRNVCAARRALPSGDWETACFTDYVARTNDSHNDVAVGLSEGDGTIHLTFDHHGDTLLYRVSSIGVATDPGAHAWGPELFGSITNQLVLGTTETEVTYPRFISKPDGGLVLMRRHGGAGNGSSLLYHYDATTHSWTRLGTFVSNVGGTYNGETNRNAYFDHPQYDDDGRLHVTWMWREATNASSNHDLHYAYSDDDGVTWYNNAGLHIATTGTNPITVSTPGIKVWTIGWNRGLLNQEASYVEDDGTVHIMTQHMPTSQPDQADFNTAVGLRTFHHYWRDPVTGTWSSQELSSAGSRPKLVVNDHGDAYMVFQSYDNRLTIARGTDAANYSDWSIIYEESAHTTGSEPLIDWQRWKSEKVLSVYAQDTFTTPGEPTPLRVLDYKLGLPDSPDDRLDLTIGATYSASSQYDASQGAEKAFDSNPETNWHACKNCWLDQWLAVDFGSSTTFDTIEIAEFGNRTRNYLIQYWANEQWETAYTGTGPFGADASETATISFPAVTGTKMRLLYKSGTGSAPAVYEMSVFAPSVEEPRLETTAKTSVRCVAGKVVLTVSTTNLSEHPIGIAVTTAFGSKQVAEVAPEKTTSAAFTTRIVDVAAGDASVAATAMVEGELLSTSTSVPYEAASCG